MPLAPPSIAGLPPARARDLIDSGAWGGPTWAQAIVVGDADLALAALAEDPGAWTNPPGGRTPLDWALAYPHRQVLEALVPTSPRPAREDFWLLERAARLPRPHAQRACRLLVAAGAPVSPAAMGYVLGTGSAWGRKFFAQHATRVFPHGPWTIAQACVWEQQRPVLPPLHPSWTPALVEAAAQLFPGAGATDQDAMHWGGAWRAVAAGLYANEESFQRTLPWATLLRQALAKFTDPGLPAQAAAAWRPVYRAYSASPEGSPLDHGHAAVARTWLAQAWAEDFGAMRWLMVDSEQAVAIGRETPDALVPLASHPNLREVWSSDHALTRLLVTLDLHYATPGMFLSPRQMETVVGALADQPALAQGVGQWLRRMGDEPLQATTVGMLGQLLAIAPQAALEPSHVQRALWERVMHRAQSGKPAQIPEALVAAGHAAADRDNWSIAMCDWLLSHGADPGIGLSVFIDRIKPWSAHQDPKAPASFLDLGVRLVAAGATWEDPPDWMASPAAPPWLAALSLSMALPASAPAPRVRL